MTSLWGSLVLGGHGPEWVLESLKALIQEYATKEHQLTAAYASAMQVLFDSVAVTEPNYANLAALTADATRFHLSVALQNHTKTPLKAP